jgi:two-component system, OmpR family, sensor histidine kinase MtrB
VTAPPAGRTGAGAGQAATGQAATGRAATGQARSVGRSVPARVLAGSAVVGSAVVGRVRAAGRRLRRRWRSSLQLRVAATTLLVSGAVVLMVGVALLHQVARGVLDNKLRAAQAETSGGLSFARSQLSQLSPSDQESLGVEARRVIDTLDTQSDTQGGGAGLFEVAILDPDSPSPTTYSKGPALVPASVPEAVQQRVRRDDLTWAYSRLVLADKSEVKGLVFGGPVHVGTRVLQLYYLFPLSSEDYTIALIQRIVLFAGLGLVLLFALIAVLVTRQVVGPVRMAARTAQRLAAGRLEERMPEHGDDELAKLAGSFNEMADSLQEKITKLEEMSRLQRRFTSDVSHELRTPLATIRMAADVLHDARPGFPPEVARSVELLQAELDRFESLLADLLEISRYDAGVAALEAEPTDLRSVVHRVVAASQPLATRAGSELVLQLPDEPVVAEVDPRRVERILRNLVGNAVEHGGGGPVEIRLAGNEQAVAVTVRDRGVGLRPGEAALVFNRFWRADPARTRGTGGTGLGLAISLEDARLHGGWLHPWGRPGMGAQFRLTLPLHPGGRLTRSPLPVVPPDAGPANGPPTTTAPLAEPSRAGAPSTGTHLAGRAPNGMTPDGMTPDGTAPAGMTSGGRAPGPGPSRRAEPHGARSGEEVGTS